MKLRPFIIWKQGNTHRELNKTRITPVTKELFQSSNVITVVCFCKENPEIMYFFVFVLFGGGGIVVTTPFPTPLDLLQRLVSCVSP